MPAGCAGGNACYSDEAVTWVWMTSLEAPLAVIAKFIYEVKPGRMADFMAKLREAAQPRFASPVMPRSFRLFRSTVPGPDTGHVVMLIEYEDMAAYGARTSAT